MNVINESIIFSGRKGQTHKQAIKCAELGIKIARMKGVIQNHQSAENPMLHEFSMRNVVSGFEMKLWGLGRTRAEARTHILIYNIANTNLAVWELSE